MLASPRTSESVWRDFPLLLRPDAFSTHLCFALFPLKTDQCGLPLILSCTLTSRSNQKNVGGEEALASDNLTFVFNFVSDEASLCR